MEGWVNPQPGFKWVLNPGPVAWQSTALPTELSRPANSNIYWFGIYADPFNYVKYHQTQMKAGKNQFVGPFISHEVLSAPWKKTMVDFLT